MQKLCHSCYLCLLCGCFVTIFNEIYLSYLYLFCFIENAQSVLQKKSDILGSLSFLRTPNPKISPKILGIG